jgi:hypothetical protein
MDSRPLRIALISEHASPLAALGGTDAGGQNPATLARRLGTRRDNPAPAAVRACQPGVRA